MSNKNVNPYWAQARQYQEKEKSKQQQKKLNENALFDQFINRRAFVIATSGSYDGIIEASTSYWLELNTRDGVLLINKRFVILIQFPSEEKGNPQGGGANGTA